MRIRLLGHYLPLSIVVWAVLETTLFFFVLFGAAMLRFHLDVASIERTTGALWPRALLFSLVMFTSLLALGRVWMSMALFSSMALVWTKRAFLQERPPRAEPTKRASAPKRLALLGVEKTRLVQRRPAT